MGGNVSTAARILAPSPGKVVGNGESKQRAVDAASERN